MQVVTSVSFDKDPPVFPIKATLTLANGTRRQIDVKILKTSGRVYIDTPLPNYSQAVAKKLLDFGIGANKPLPSASISSLIDPSSSSSSRSGAFSLFAQLTATQNLETGTGNTTTNLMAVTGDESAQEAAVVEAIDPNANQQLADIGSAALHGTEHLVHAAGTAGRGIAGLLNGGEFTLDWHWLVEGQTMRLEWPRSREGL